MNIKIIVTLFIFCSIFSVSICQRPPNRSRAIYGPFFGRRSKTNAQMTPIKTPNDGYDVKGVKTDNHQQSFGVKGSTFESPAKRRPKRSICDDDEQQKKSIFRLPSNVIPNHYNLDLDIDLKTLTYRGNVSIYLKFDKMKTRKAKDVIKIHSVDLNLNRVVLQKGNKNGVQAIKTNYDDKTQIVTITFPPNTITKRTRRSRLDINFDGVISDKLRGLYRSTYSTSSATPKETPNGSSSASISEDDESDNENADADDEKKVVSGVDQDKDAKDDQNFGYKFYASTQFESIDARRAFPCFDEPSLKATFNVTITADERLTALSNGPEIASEMIKDGDKDEIRKKKTIFERTPKMSTYLLAFIVGSFDFISDRTKSGILVRVFTPKGRAQEASFALQIATKSLDYYEDYFDIKFPMKKCDQVSINDFSAGAMENWGLITYRESDILVNENETSLKQKQNIAITIAHEVSHQWFGNLVTMSWWTDLWLNEGFATFMMYQSVDTFFPEWNIWLTFITEDYQDALELDALENSHPIEVNVEDPKDTDEIFDNISYEKGASVIRMVADWIGDKDFRRGLKLYLESHSFGNTCTKDLWASLEMASNKPVIKVLSGWTSMKGFPLLSVTLIDRDADFYYLSLSQEKFSSDADKDLSVDDKEQMIWNVPIKFSVGEMNSTDKKIFQDAEDDVLSDQIRAVSVPTPSIKSWIKLNANSIGFYRTIYKSEPLLDALIPAIKDKNLGVEDRLQIVSDNGAFVISGRQSSDQFLSFINNSYRDEDNYFVWSSIISMINQIDDLIENSQDKDLRTSFDKFIINLLDQPFERLKWENQDIDQETLLQTMILYRLGLSDKKDVITEAKERFNNRDEILIKPDFRNLVYKLSAKNSDADEFRAFFELYKNASSSSERDRIGDALGLASDEEIINEVINFSLNVQNVRNQDFPYILRSLSSNSFAGRSAVWTFFKNNQRLILDKYSNGALLNALIDAATNFGSFQKLAEISEFFENGGAEMKKRATRTVEQTMERIKISAKWAERDLDKIRTFLSQ